MHNRIKWIDSSRGIAFLMIIYSHLDYTNKFVMFYFSPIFLTTFFFISGYLFNKKYSFIHVIEQRARTILLPFFIYGIINILLSQIITFSNHPSLSKDLIDFLVQIRGNNDGLWFLACLFISTIPFYFLIKHIKSTQMLLILSGTLFVLNSIADFPAYPWHLQFICPAIFYMTLGYLYRLYENKFEFLNSTKYIVLTSSFYVIFVSFYWKHTGHSVSFNSTKLVLDGWVITITGIALCILISKRLYKIDNLLTFIGANSLLYFALHGKVYSLLQVLTKKLLFLTNIQPHVFLNLLLGIALTLAVSIILIIPISLINKYVPWTTGKGFSLTK